MKKLSEIDIGDLIQDLQNFDINDLKKIGAAPLPAKIAAIAVVCIALAVTGFFMLTKPQLQLLDAAEAKEVELRTEFDHKSSKASNLEAYKQQLEDMRRSFGALLRQLPDKTEIETLLVDISQTAIASGLDIQYFKPEGLNPKEFYKEFPIKVRVIGRYHQFARFVSGVAALPRIVTLQNITIDQPKDKKGVLLEMQMTAVTYQYMDENEAAAAAQPNTKPGAQTKPVAKTKAGH